VAIDRRRTAGFGSGIFKRSNHFRIAVIRDGKPQCGCSIQISVDVRATLDLTNNLNNPEILDLAPNPENRFLFIA